MIAGVAFVGAVVIVIIVVVLFSVGAIVPVYRECSGQVTKRRLFQAMTEVAEPETYDTMEMFMDPKTTLGPSISIWHGAFEHKSMTGNISFRICPRNIVSLRAIIASNNFSLVATHRP
jgi:hypothetical protein